MKILFGVQTTGNGHISCSRVVVSALKAAGHEVTVLFSGHGRSAFWDCASFQPFTESRGLTFVVEQGEVSYAKTALQTRPFELIRDIRALDLSGFDLVISNFEPICAWAAKLQKKPSIGLSHQAAFQSEIPKSPGNHLARLVMRYYAPTQHHLGLHWHHFGQALLPPVIDPELLALTPNEIPNHGHVVVCLPFENAANVCAILAAFKSHEFRFFTDVPAISERGNVTLHPFGRATFLRELRTCSAVIAHAGFELPSEALHLGKKLLVRPLQRQYEQLCNAQALVQNGLGQAMARVNAASIAAFLDSPPMVPRRYPDVAQAIARWVGTADLHSSNAQRSLAEQLW